MTGFYLAYSSFLQGIAGSGAGEIEVGDVEFFIQESLRGRITSDSTLRGKLVCEGD